MDSSSSRAHIDYAYFYVILGINILSLFPYILLIWIVLRKKNANKTDSDIINIQLGAACIIHSISYCIATVKYASSFCIIQRSLYVFSLLLIVSFLQGLSYISYNNFLNPFGKINGNML